VISITGLNRAVLLSAFFNASDKVLVMEKPKLVLMKLAVAEGIIRDLEDRSREVRRKLPCTLSYVDQVRLEQTLDSIWAIGEWSDRILNINLRRDEFDPQARDKVYGVGNSEFIISMIKCGLPSDHHTFFALRQGKNLK
jgi:hypothetical protein